MKPTHLLAYYRDRRTQPLFPLGRIYCSPEVFVNAYSEQFYQALEKHRTGDWTLVTPAIQQANLQAMLRGKAVYSCHRGASPSTARWLWVVTAGDRTRTTVTLVPVEMLHFTSVWRLHWSLRSQLRRAFPCPVHPDGSPAFPMWPEEQGFLKFLQERE